MDNKNPVLYGIYNYKTKEWVPCKDLQHLGVELRRTRVSAGFRTSSGVWSGKSFSHPPKHPRSVVAIKIMSHHAGQIHWVGIISGWFSTTSDLLKNLESLSEDQFITRPLITEWHLIDLLTRKITTFDQSKAVIAYLAELDIHYSITSNRRKPFAEGRYVVTPDSREIPGLLKQYPTPRVRTYRKIEAIHVYECSGDLPEYLKSYSDIVEFSEAYELKRPSVRTALAQHRSDDVPFLTKVLVGGRPLGVFPVFNTTPEDIKNTPPESLIFKE